MNTTPEQRRALRTDAEFSLAYPHHARFCDIKVLVVLLDDIEALERELAEIKDEARHDGMDRNLCT